MKRINSLGWHPSRVLVVRLWGHLATIVRPVVTTTATVTEAIVTEAMTDILLCDMSEYHLLGSFRDTDQSSECTIVIGGGTGSAQEAQAGGGIDHAFSTQFHVNF